MSEPIFQFTQDYIRPPKGQAIYFIKDRDLLRIENQVKHINQQGGFYQNLGLCSTGIAAGGFPALISLYYAQGVSVTSWVISWGFLFASFFVAVFAFIASKRENKQAGASKENILEEIQWIKASAQPTQVEAARG